MMSELTALVVVRQDALTLRSIYTRCVRVLEYEGHWRSCTGGNLLEAIPYRDWTTISHSALCVCGRCCMQKGSRGYTALAFNNRLLQQKHTLLHNHCAPPHSKSS